MIGRSKRVNLVFPILILILTWPLLGGYVPVFARVWIWTLIGSVAAVFLCPSYYLQSGIKWIALYALILLINFFVGDAYYSSFPLICLEVGVLLFSSSVAYYLFFKSNNRTDTFVMNELLLVISVIAILTLFLNSVEPGIVRSTVENAYKGGDYEYMYRYYRAGMTNYALPHALPIIIPPLVMGINNKNHKVGYRILLLAFLVLVLLLIYVSAAATPVFLSFFMLILSIWTHAGSIRSNSTWLLVLSLLFLPFIFINDLAVMTIDFFAGLTSGEGTVYDRLIEIRQSVMGDAEGDLAGRLTLYESSFGEFVGSILLGSKGEVGGHSALLDRLASLGIVGFIPLVVFVWVQLKKMYLILPKNVKVFYIEGVLAGIIMLFTKNMSNWEMWLMLFIMLPLLTLKLSEGNK